MPAVTIEPFPFGRRFAVSLVDDTDCAVLETIRDVYRVLDEYGVRSTKTVWPLEATAFSGGYRNFPLAGDTLQRREYRAFCEDLHGQGFEIAMHTASAGDSRRDATTAAYRLFESAFGHPPLTNVMHARNRENIYWGKYSVHNPLASKLISLVEPLEFAGHRTDSEYYWGDVCRERTRYVRLFETIGPNTLRFDPATPFHDPLKPDVPWWFSSSYGGGRRLFPLLSRHNLETLAKQRGAAIVHTYLCQYARPNGPDGGVDPAFGLLLRSLAERTDGWYVPIVSLLDRIRSLRALELTASGNELRLRNRGPKAVHALALATDACLIRPGNDCPLERNGYGQVQVGTLAPGAAVHFVAPRQTALQAVSYPSPPPAYDTLLPGQMKRILWQFCHGRRRFMPANAP
jgi:hypothetical protein